MEKIDAGRYMKSTSTSPAPKPEKKRKRWVLSGVQRTIAGLVGALVVLSIFIMTMLGLVTSAETGLPFLEGVVRPFTHYRSDRSCYNCGKNMMFLIPEGTPSKEYSESRKCNYCKIMNRYRHGR